MRLHLLLPLLLLAGCAALNEGLFEPESSFQPTGRPVGSAIEIGRDEWAHYAVAYLPENVRRNGDVVTIMTEWITIGDASRYERKVFELDCSEKRFRIVGWAPGPGADAGCVGE